MQDGLYQVTTKVFCAGFLIERGHIVMCAPILRKYLRYYMTLAVRVELNVEQ